MTEWVVSGLLIIGGLFGLIGSFGLLKLRQPMQRLHAPTKATTLGLGATLIAATIQLSAGAHLLIAAFLFVTAPLTALYLARAHLRQPAPPEPPDAAPDLGPPQP